jgi:predicted DNA-binding protein (MmcQ/YjbR family)
MTHNDIRAYCTAKPGVTEETPFDDTTLVYKVMGKMFALAGFDSDFINIKCDPDIAIALREQYDAVQPGYHMNKRLWNSVYYQTGALPPALVYRWIDDSYNLVVAGLPKKLRAELAMPDKK